METTQAALQKMNSPELRSGLPLLGTPWILCRTQVARLSVRAVSGGNVAKFRVVAKDVILLTGPDAYVDASAVRLCVFQRFPTGGP